jgi:hypothetical protein
LYRCTASNFNFVLHLFKKRLLGHFFWHFKFCTISLFHYKFFSSWYIFSLKYMQFSKITSITHSIRKYFNYLDIFNRFRSQSRKFNASLHIFLFDWRQISRRWRHYFRCIFVIIFGINSLKSIAIFKIFTLVFFIHNVKMWNPLNIVCYALHQNFALISIFKILFIAIIRANWFYGFRN